MSLFFQAAAPASNVVLRTFDDDKVGAPPPGFTLAAGRDAAPDKWAVRRDGNVRGLVHEGTASPPDSFAVAIFSGAQYGDVEVSVRLKATGGGRTAGLVWKYQDPMNYYVAQLDLVRQEVAVYRVASGNRIRIEREDDLELDPDAWHSLRIRHEDGQIRFYLAGIRIMTERDRFPRVTAGVGIWVTGDSTVMFDDFRVEDEKSVEKPKVPAATLPVKP
jgi:hypothetical protein